MKLLNRLLELRLEQVILIAGVLLALGAGITAGTRHLGSGRKCPDCGGTLDVRIETVSQQPPHAVQSKISTCRECGTSFQDTIRPPRP